ncbi:MAG: helix-turn-helix domain-containing protein, partial [Candidatus Hydrothermae bacterium]|nr:helix-turn-helix domain-containing protein [Candidatus Hydrothermae bacterium]
VLFAPALRATDAPHTYECRACHDIHDALGGAGLEQFSTNLSVCQSCHQPGGDAERFVITDQNGATPGASGTTHRFNVNSVNPTYEAVKPTHPEVRARLEYNPSFPDSAVVCSTCHDQHSQRYVPFLRTVGPTRVCILSRRDFLDLIRRYPDVALKVFERQTLRIQELERRLEALALQSTRRRIARLLVTLSEKFGSDGIPLTHQELASMAGCARETASMILSSFQKEGWIETGKGRIRILDAEGLRRETEAPRS